MKNYRKHIDDFFREKLGKYTETPPDDVWDSLDARLDTLKPTVPGSPHKWLWHAGIVSMIVVLSVSLVHKFTGKKSDNATSTNAQIAQVSSTTPNTLPTTPSTADVKPVDVPAAPATEGAPADATQQAGDSRQVAEGPATDAKGQQAAVAKNNGGTTNGAGSKHVSVTKQHANKLKNQPKSHNSNSKNNTSSAVATQQESNYGSGDAAVNNNTAKVLPATELANVDGGLVPGGNKANSQPKNTQNVPGTFKQNTNEKKTTTPAKNVKHKADFNRWEMGVKAGFEGWAGGDAARKAVISPYIQYNLSPKFALMMQPAAKFAHTGTKTIGNDRTYYEVNEDGKITQNGPSDLKTRGIGGGVDTYYVTHYTLTQTHDSIVKSNTIGGNYMEFELPILVKYNISKSASVYGGLNIIYSQSKGVTEHTYIQKNILKSADTAIQTQTLPITTPTISNAFTYTGTPYSSYDGPLFPNTIQESQIRFGAMLGFSYEYSNRWLFDALIQQNPAKTDMKGGYNINIPLSSTYFRLSVGYKLTK